MQTFQQFLLERDEKQQLRKVLIGNMGLEDVLASGEGEQIMLTQLELDKVRDKLMHSDLWTRLDPKVQDAAERIFKFPGNKQLTDLLDTLCQGDLDLGSSVTQDDEPSPQTTQ